MAQYERSNRSGPSVAIVGARGLVGQEALSILSKLGWGADRVRVFGSARSVGLKLEYIGTRLEIEPIQSLAESPPDFALLCTDAETSIACAEVLRDTQCTIIDNSSAFRMNQGVPLVIPEVNWETLDPQSQVIANPNCSTIMLLTALNPLRGAFGVRSVQVTTYQAVSGAGRAGLETLRAQTRASVLGEEIPSGVFPVVSAFDVFEHESGIDPQSGFNGEESKMIGESRKIWGDPELRLLPTCVRVPVERAHAQAISVELNRSCSVGSIREVLSLAPGVSVWEGDSALTPASIAGSDDVWVGRIRVDPSDSRRALLWVCCDQIRKGAALNAIQIMQRLIEIRDQSSASSDRLTSIIEASGYACSS